MFGISIDKSISDNVFNPASELGLDFSSLMGDERATDRTIMIAEYFAMLSKTSTEQEWVESQITPLVMKQKGFTNLNETYAFIDKARESFSKVTGIRYRLPRASR